MKENLIGSREYNSRVIPEIKPLLSSFTEVIVNGWKTRTIRHLEVNGDLEAWHSVKGGAVSGKTAVNYEVLYNPETAEWLKMVPPGVKKAEKVQKILQKSADIGRTVLEVSGLTEHARRLQDCVVKTEDGSSLYGFKTPHIGPTVEFGFMQLEKLGPDKSRVTKEFLSKAYASSFSLAARLYFEHSIWTNDPNPGNVVINLESAVVSLIDFVSQPELNPEGVKLRSEGIEEEADLRGVRVLYERFERQANLRKIPFYRNFEEVKDSFGTFISERKKRFEGI